MIFSPYFSVTKEEAESKRARILQSVRTQFRQQKEILDKYHINVIRAAAARTYPRSERPFVKKLIEDPDLAEKMKDYLSGTLTKLTDLGATAFVLGKILIVVCRNIYYIEFIR